MSKIAFVIQDLVGQGVQFATATMARAFASHGFDVDLVVSKVHDDLVSLGSEQAVKAAGKLATVGKTYVMEEGDIVEFKFNVSK